MLRIVLNGEDLDLTDTNLRWESVNTLFEDNALQSDYSFPFTLIFSDTNMRALGYAHKADVPTTSVTFAIILFLNQRSIRSKLIINGTKKGGFNVNISGGILGLINADKKLNEIDYGANIDLGAGFVYSGQYTQPNWKKAIALPPHYNPNFYANNPTFQGVVNRQDAFNGTYAQNDISFGSKYCIVAFLYIHFILKKIFDENGLTPIGNYWNDPEISTALLYSNYGQDKKEEQGCLVKTDINQPFIHTGIYDGVGGLAWTNLIDLIIFKDTLPDCYDPQNNWNNTYADKYDIPTPGDYAVDLQLTLSNISDSGALVSVQVQIIYENSSGVITDSVVEDWFHTSPTKSFTMAAAFSGCDASGKIYARVSGLPDSISVADVGQSPIMMWTVNGGAQMTITRTDVADYNLMDTIVVPKNNVPDLTVSDFLKAIKNFAQTEINIDWDEHTVQLNYADRTISDLPAVDLTELADPDFEQIFDNKSLGFVLNYDFGTSDTLLTGKFLPIDQTKLIGEFNTPADLPTPLLLNNFAIVKNKNKVMQVQVVSAVLTWVEYSDYYYPITVGAAGVQRKIELAPMLMTDAQTNESTDGLANTKKCLMPTISEPGSSILFDQGINAPSLRVVFMRGQSQSLTLPPIGGYYVYASPTNIDLNGNTVGDYNLKLQGDDGWYIRFLQKILLAIDNSAVFQYLILLPTSYLQYKGKVQIKNVNYLVKNISMYIGSTVKTSIVKLLKL